MKIKRIEVRDNGKLLGSVDVHFVESVTINGVIDAYVEVGRVCDGLDNIKITRDIKITSEDQTLVITLGPTRGVANLMRLAAEVLDARENE